MAGFRFRFQSLLNIKEQIEEREKLLLGKRMTALKEAEERLYAIETDEANYIQQFYAKNGQTVKAKDLIELNHSIGYYKNLKMEQKQVVKEKKDAVLEQREVLRQALIHRKSYEKLKEKAQEAYIKEQGKKDDQIVDEVISYKYHG